MWLIDSSISISELREMAESSFASFVKAVVDVEKKIMVVDADLHADQESLLLSSGSKQEDLWGINLYPNKKRADFIEFDSMINIRPYQDNQSRYVEDKKTRDKIRRIITDLIKDE